MEKNTIVYNDLIAQFIGYKRDNMEYFIPQHGKINSQGIWIDTFPKENLKFHKSWDWLMPVIKQIREIVNVELSINDFECVREMKLTVYPYDYTIEQVYQAVIEFIEWFNYQK